MKTQFFRKNIYDTLRKWCLNTRMLRTEAELNSFKWVDYTNPSTEVLGQIAIELNLEEKVLHNCLDSDYLPHLETYANTQFLILRMMEPGSKTRADTVQELTTKIAIFLCPTHMVTIHRLPLSEVSEVAKKIKETALEQITKAKIISFFYEQVSLGFDKPLAEIELKLQSFEETLFSKKKSKNFLQEGFYLKRKATAFRKVLKLTLELLSKLILQTDCVPEQFQQSKARLERNLFYAEDVFENIQSLLSLHVAIESQKTNEASFRTTEIMRVLTVLTIFFLPLNFIAGVFGMNFQYIPLLINPVGFWISMLIMLLVSLSLGLYLFKRGWLDKPEIRTDTKQKGKPNE